MRDIGYLQRLAEEACPAIGAYAAAVLDHPLPWTKMRQVYALLGLVRTWGPARVHAACRRALDAEAVSVALIGRMLARGTESQPVPHTPPLPLPGLPAPRFARDRSHFAVAVPPPAGPDRPSPPSCGRCCAGSSSASYADPARAARPARAHNLGHAEFLELILSDEVTRRDATSAQRRARAAGLDPAMRRCAR